MNKRIVLTGLVVAFALCGFAADGAQAQPGQEVRQGTVVSFTPSAAGQGMTLADMASAKALPLPQSPVAPVRPLAGSDSVRESTPGFVPGAEGSGRTKTQFVPLNEGEEDVPAPEEFGTSNHVFTTSRVDFSSNTVSKMYPYRPAGKLYFKIGTGNYVCSASLIKRGVIVTAAHCVTAFGGAWYTNWVFVPAKYDTLAPYQQWNGATAWVMTAYKNGTDSCAVSGVVCANDIAVIKLTAKTGTYPGTSTGWYGYGWDGYGFTSGNLALINQLGYPVSHDAGNRMQRTDSEGFVDAGSSGNTVWGTRQTGGSSGGPELVNLGVRASLSGTSVGSEADMNIVVGVTSWGYTSTVVKQQGASPFKSTNIVTLVNTACTGGTTTWCKP